jgi:hypothetical protein
MEIKNSMFTSQDIKCILVANEEDLERIKSTLTIRKPMIRVVDIYANMCLLCTSPKYVRYYFGSLQYVLYNPVTKTTFFIPILDIVPIQYLGILYECILFDAKTLQYKIFVIFYNPEQQLLISCCYNSQIQKWSWKDINIHITTKIVCPRHKYQSCTITNNQVYCILYDPFWIMVSIDIETNVFLEKMHHGLQMDVLSCFHVKIVFLPCLLLE